MDDTKLLELAGRAAGEQYDAANNPLERDDLALRLAVKLRIDLHFDWETSVRFGEIPIIEAMTPRKDDGSCFCPMKGEGDDPAATARRLITEAAAAIGATAQGGWR